MIRRSRDEFLSECRLRVAARHTCKWEVESKANAYIFRMIWWENFFFPNLLIMNRKNSQILRTIDPDLFADSVCQRPRRLPDKRSCKRLTYRTSTNTNFKTDVVQQFYYDTKKISSTLRKNLVKKTSRKRAVSRSQLIWLSLQGKLCSAPWYCLIYRSFIFNDSQNHIKVPNSRSFIRYEQVWPDVALISPRIPENWEKALSHGNYSPINQSINQTNLQCTGQEAHLSRSKSTDF